MSAGVLLVVSGAFVTCGWMLDHPAIIQMRAWLAPMPFMSALCLALSGLALAANGSRRRPLMTIAVCSVVVLTGLTLLEYATGIGFAADARFVHAGSFGGRMAPVTAIALGGGAVASFLLNEESGRARIAIGVTFGTLPLLLGAMALFSYAIDNPTIYAWHGLRQMHPHTAAGSVVLGLGLVTLAWRDSQTEERGLPPWLPLYVTGFTLAAALLLAAAVRSQELQDRQQRAVVAAKGAEDAVESELAERREAFEQMAARLSTAGYAAELAWQRDADMYVAQSQDPYMVIYRLDRDLRAIGVSPTRDVALPTRTEILNQPARRDAVERALTLGRSLQSRQFTITPGTAGFVLAVPVGNKGVLCVELASEPLLRRVLARFPYAVRIQDGEDVLYSQGSVDDSGDAITLSAADAGWRMTMSLPERSAGRLPSVPKVIVVFGALLAALLGWSVRLARGLARRARKIRRTNEQLSSEIAQRGRVEAQLRDANAFHQAVLDNASHLIISLDPDGRVRSFNATAERLLGYRADEVLGHVLPPIFDGDEVAARSQARAAELGQPVEGLDVFAAGLRVGETTVAEWTHISREGRRFPVELSIRPLADDTGAVTGFVWISSDITDRRLAESRRRQAEESLRHAEELLHSVLDSSLSGVVAFQAVRAADDHIADLRCLLANPAAERLLEQASGSMVGRTHVELAGSDNDNDVLDAYRQVIETGKPMDLEHQSDTFGGRWFRIVACKLGTDGLAVTFEDITQRRAMNAELEQYIKDVEESRDRIHEQSVTLQWQAEALTTARDEALAGARELERALKMQADFVSFASHQLRTPLSGMRWLLELAREEPSQTEDLRSYIADSLASAERLIGLVNDLLDVSRLEGGRVATATVRVDLAECCREVAASIQPNVAHAGHRLVLAGTDEAAATMADPQLLRQVIDNLLSNAVKYTPSGGEVSLAITRARGELRCTIEDNGLGVPDEARPRLFEKFFRADNVATMETEGTGLGLYMVRLILQRLGGRVWHEPREDGTGSRFVFVMPTAQPDEADHVAA